MARHERSFDAAGEARLARRDALSLSTALDGVAESDARAKALACFLSAGDGWDEAARRLDGAFADCPVIRSEKDIAGR